MELTSPVTESNADPDPPGVKVSVQLLLQEGDRQAQIVPPVPPNIGLPFQKEAEEESSEDQLFCF